MLFKLINPSCEIVGSYAAVRDLIENNDGTIEITLNKCDNGYQIIKENDRAQISYNALTDFLRAIFYISLKPRGNYTIKRDGLNKLGVMIDCARGAVKTVDSIKRLVSRIALLGYNYIELYTEDCFETEGEKFCGYMRGKYTRAEIAEIVAFSAKVGIEVVPCIQTLAHLSHIFAHGEYDCIRDCNDILLVNEDRTYKFIENVIKSARQSFTSDRINIGMDEAHMVGLGKYLDRFGYKDRFDIISEHLKKVIEICKKYGYSADIWSDMYFRLAFNGEYLVDEGEFTKEQISKVNHDVSLIYWDYYDQRKSHYDFLFKRHFDLSDKIKFAAGAWSWTGFAPANIATERTIVPALESCKDNAIDDVVMTCWGDDGSECSLFALMNSFIFASFYMTEKRVDKDLLNAASKKLTGYDYDENLAMDLPNILHKSDKYKFLNPSKYLLYCDLLQGNRRINEKEDYRGYYEKYAKVLLELKSRGGEFSYIFDTLYNLCDVLSLKCGLSAQLRRAYFSKDLAQLQATEKDISSLVIRIDKFYNSFRAQWNKENKQFGFEIHDVRLGGLKQRLLHVMQTIADFRLGKIDKIEEIEEYCDSAAYEDDFNGCTYYNYYSGTIGYNSL